MTNSGTHRSFCTILTTSAGPTADHAPDREHPAEGAKILRERGYSEELIRAVMSHADYCNTRARLRSNTRCSPVTNSQDSSPRAATSVRQKAFFDLEMESVKKKLKDKAFAKGVSRDDVRNGAAELGIPLEEHIAFCIGGHARKRRCPRPPRQLTRFQRRLACLQCELNPSGSG